MADPVATLSRFVGNQAAARDRIAANVMSRLTVLWRQAGSHTDPGAVERFVESALALIQAGQQQTAQVTASYLQTVLAQVPGVEAPAAVSVDLPASLRGVDDPSEPYRRPFLQWRRDQQRGIDADAARDRAYRRLMVMADTDLTMGMREGSRQAAAASPQVIGMRRIIRPELSRGGTCGLCVAAADRIYKVRQLLPIHARCNCETAPVTAIHDPGLQLNQDDFALLYGPDSDTSKGAMARGRYRVAEHGEYGPVLVRADDHFRGPDDLAA